MRSDLKGYLIRQGVIVVAVNDEEELLLTKEYAAGFHEYQTSPKAPLTITKRYGGRARELAEEVGFGANNVEFVKTLTVAPGHMGYEISVVFATDLYQKS